MNIHHLRQSARTQWLRYYADNREWLIRLGIWVNCEGQRRPASSFILGTLAVIEPKLAQLMPLVVDLNNHPDRIVAALGLNFNPEDYLDEVRHPKGAVIEAESHQVLPATPRPKVLAADSPSQGAPPQSVAIDQEVKLASRSITQLIARRDEQCAGRSRTGAKTATRLDPPSSLIKTSD